MHLVQYALWTSFTGIATLQACAQRHLCFALSRRILAQQPADIFAVIKWIPGEKAGKSGIFVPPDTTLVARFGNRSRGGPQRRSVGQAGGDDDSRWPFYF